MKARSITGRQIHEHNVALKDLARFYEGVNEIIKHPILRRRYRAQIKRDKAVATKLREAAQILREARDLALSGGR